MYDKVKANPTVNVVKGGVEMFKSIGADYIIAIGGGSSIDTAKGIAIIVNNPEHADVKAWRALTLPKTSVCRLSRFPPLPALPRRSPSTMLLPTRKKRRKFVCADCHDIPVVAIIDPDMMSSMPKGLTAATGMDALTHAIEGYITKGAWELTDMMHLKAIEIIARSLRAAVENDPKGREDMALGQYVAGMGLFLTFGLGIVHSMGASPWALSMTLPTASPTLSFFPT